MKKKKSKSGHLNIAMIGQKRIPSREGGVEIVVEELSTRLVSLGHSVTCFNRKGHNVAGSEFDEKATNIYQGVRCIRVCTIDRKGLAALSSSFFAALRAAFGKYDVVHFHAEGPAFMCWIPKAFGKKVVVTVHGLDHQRAKWGKFASWYILNGEKNAVRYADEIIVLSKNLRQYFLDTYGRTTRLIPNGIGLPEQCSAELICSDYDLSKDSYILYLGRLVPEKGERYLIEAFRNVKTEKKLVIAGGSSDTQSFADELREMARGDDRIIFTGFVQGQRLRELYSNAYVYTLPSDLEGMPLSLLEGMSYGNCCLTSDIPECAEVVEDKAVLFQKSNVADLRNKLQLLCDNPVLVEEYRKNAAEFILEKYGWNDVVKQTEQLYFGTGRENEDTDDQ